jgi:hypothetical protein
VLTTDGKYKCDYKFGHWTIAWNNEATLCIDDLLRVVESQPRLSRGLDGMVRKKRIFFEPLLHKNDQFAKTGSGQTWEKAHNEMHFLHVEETPDDRKDRGSIMRSEAGTVYREHFLGRYVSIERLAQKSDNIHLIVIGHQLELLCKEPVTTQRSSSEGKIITRTTSLYEEMQLIASPERGVARFWTYPPTPSRLEAQEVNATMESYREMTVPETQQGDAV